MATYSSILACRIPWTEEPGGLQSMGSQRVRHDSETTQPPVASEPHSSLRTTVLIFSFPPSLNTRLILT